MLIFIGIQVPGLQRLSSLHHFASTRVQANILGMHGEERPTAPNTLAASGQGSYFAFTVTTNRGRRILCNDDVRSALREAVTQVRRRMPFAVHAWVLLPDHLHCIWRLPPGDLAHQRRWTAIKSRVTREVGRRYFLRTWLASGRHETESGRIWARNHWWQAIEGAGELARFTAYLHWNPVAHGHVKELNEWPYSTIHRQAHLTGVALAGAAGLPPAVESNAGTPVCFGEAPAL